MNPAFYVEGKPGGLPMHTTNNYIHYQNQVQNILKTYGIKQELMPLTFDLLQLMQQFGREIITQLQEELPVIPELTNYNQKEVVNKRQYQYELKHTSIPKILKEYGL